MASRITVRTDLDPASLTRALVSQVYAIDRNQPVSEVVTLEGILREEEYATPRFSLVLFSVFGFLGLALAVIGVYGVMSSTVAQQRHEIGVRMALGAEARTITRMVILRGSRVLLAGMALGLVGSFVAARTLAGTDLECGSVRPAGVRGRIRDSARRRHPGVRLAGPARRTDRSDHRTQAGLNSIPNPNPTDPESRIPRSLRLMMRRSFVLPPFRPASCAVLLACAVGFASAATIQVQGTPQSGASGSAPPATVAAAPTPQFPPLGTGLSAEERGTLQAAVDQLAKRVAELKKTYPAPPMADRVADVEVYLDAVRRPLKYDERLYAPKDSTPIANALQTLATGTERAEQLAAGHIALDGDQRCARLLLRDRRLGAAVHPDDAGEL